MKFYKVLGIIEGAGFIKTLECLYIRIIYSDMMRVMVHFRHLGF